MSDGAEEALHRARTHLQRATLEGLEAARALVQAGHVESTSEAFDRLIGDRHPAFIPTDLGSPWDALDVILQAGGIHMPF